MRACVRGAPPDALASSERVDKWTAAWVKRRATWRQAEEDNPRAPAFNWPTHDGATLNHLLPPGLREMTTAHCSYCDAFPVQGVSVETIDHFRPKSNERFEGLVVTWSNLFYACACCQAHKGEHFDDTLLKPDETEYRFERYFVYQPTTGELDAHPGATSDEQERARETIRCFGLNLSGRPSHRKRRFEEWVRAGENPDVDNDSYRFLFDPEVVPEQPATPRTA